MNIETFAYLSGRSLKGIFPSKEIDGHFLICQGDPTFPHWNCVFPNPASSALDRALLAEFGSYFEEGGVRGFVKTAEKDLARKKVLSDLGAPVYLSERGVSRTDIDRELKKEGLELRVNHAINEHIGFVVSAYNLKGSLASAVEDVTWKAHAVSSEKFPVFSLFRDDKIVATALTCFLSDSYHLIANQAVQSGANVEKYFRLLFRGMLSKRESRLLNDANDPMQILVAESEGFSRIGFCDFVPLEVVK